MPRAALGEAYDRSSDLGIAVAEVLRAAGHAPDPELSPTLPEVAAAFDEIEAASGPARKAAVLRTLLERSDPLTAKYIVKVLGGDLRIGLREGLVEAAIARAFDRKLDDVKWAGMLVGDVGRLAGLARDDELATASLALLPTRSSSCSRRQRRTPPRRSAASARGLGRGQVRRHPRLAQSVAARCVSARATSIDIGSRATPGDRRRGHEPCLGRILDGEILAWRDGTVLPFIALQGRLGRKAPSAAIQAEVPVISTSPSMRSPSDPATVPRSSRSCAHD